MIAGALLIVSAIAAGAVALIKSATAVDPTQVTIAVYGCSSEYYRSPTCDDIDMVSDRGGYAKLTIGSDTLAELTTQHPDVAHLLCSTENTTGVDERILLVPEQDVFLGYRQALDVAHGRAVCSVRREGDRPATLVPDVILKH